MFGLTSSLDLACDALALEGERSLLASRRVGAVSGVAVSVERHASRGDADAVVVARPPRRPDVGLHAHGASVLPCLDRKVETGDAAFDGVFVTHAAPREEDAARVILARSVTRVLRRLAGVGWPVLTDDALVFTFSLQSTTAEEVTARVRWCVECALAVSERAAALDAPHPLRQTGVAAAFEAEARARAMAFQRNALCAEGAVKKGYLTVRWRTRAPTSVDHFTPPEEAVGWRARLRFDEPLGVGLTLRPARLTDRVKSAVGLRDLQTGDDAFDRAWLIEARDEPGAKALLHGDARRWLTDLAALGVTVALDDEGVAFEGALPTSPDPVVRAFELLDGGRDACGAPVRPRNSREFLRFVGARGRGDA